MNEKNESMLLKDKITGVPVTVSGNDIVPLLNGADAMQMVDILSAEQSETITEVVDMSEVCEKLDVTNATLALLTFFTIFAWVEQKIRSGVRRIMKHE